MLRCFRRVGFHSLAFQRFFRPSVLERDGAIEHELAGRAVFIECEVGEALELIAQFRLRIVQARLAFGGDDFQALWVQDRFEIAAVAVWLGFGKEAVLEAALGVNRVRGADPVNRPFDFAARRRAAGFAIEVGGAAEFDNVAR